MAGNARIKYRLKFAPFKYKLEYVYMNISTQRNRLHLPTTKCRHCRKWHKLLIAL